MIVGIGIDLVDIVRMKRVLERWGKRFIERVFTEDEKEYALSKRYPHIHLSGRFAIKEALFKAIGGGTNPWIWKEVETFNDRDGAPKIRLYGGLKRLISKKHINSVHISISHDHAYSIGQVILEKK